MNLHRLSPGLMIIPPTVRPSQVASSVTTKVQSPSTPRRTSTAEEKKEKTSCAGQTTPIGERQAHTDISTLVEPKKNNTSI